MTDNEIRAITSPTDFAEKIASNLSIADTKVSTVPNADVPAARIDVPVAYHRDGYALRVTVTAAHGVSSLFRIEPSIVHDGDPVGIYPFSGAFADADESGVAYAAGIVQRDVEVLSNILAPSVRSAVA